MKAAVLAVALVLVVAALTRRETAHKPTYRGYLHE